MRKFQVVFVLGGPGSGKGTQCSLIEKTFGFRHLSAGQLLRNEQSKPSSTVGATIRQIIGEGKIVPSHITIQLLKAEMERNAANTRNFLIDGFPRNMENMQAWKQLSRHYADCPFLLHLVCSEGEMMRRLGKRAQKEGRSDDVPHTIAKRFHTYKQETLSVIAEFEKEKKVREIDADHPPERIFEQIRPIFEEFHTSTNTL